MATQPLSTPPDDSLWLLGSSPYFAIPVDRRPTSFADALHQYQQAKRQEEALCRRNNGAITSEQWIDQAVEKTAEAYRRLMSLPSPTVAALAEKVAATLAEHPCNVVDIGPIRTILADAEALAGRL